MAEEGKTEPKPAATNSPVERVREAAKWLIGAFAAIGALLIGGVQLSDAGDLTWDDDAGRLVLAGLGLALGLGGVMAAILQNVRMLLPSVVTIQRLQNEDGLASYFNGNPELLPGPTNTVEEFVADYRSRLSDYERASQKYDESGDPGDKAGLDQASKRLASSERAMREVLYLANGKATEKLFNDDVREKMCTAAAVAAVGVGLFAWAANPPEEKKESGEKPVLGVAPSLGRLTFKPAAEPQLKQALGARCEIEKVHVLVVGGTKKEPEVVSIPRTGCDAVRFVGGPELAEVIPLR